MMRRLGLQLLGVLLGISLGASVGIVIGSVISPNGTANQTPRDSISTAKTSTASAPAAQSKAASNIATRPSSKANGFEGNSLAVSPAVSSTFVQVSREIPAVLSVGVCGDQDNNGLVNVFDAIIDLQIIVGKLEPTPAQMFLSHGVRDGEINVFDVILTLQHIVGTAEIDECGPVE